ncbi:MAG: hypothetical protein V1722_02005 [Candidatus Micrarchaeota archaeon]
MEEVNVTPKRIGNSWGIIIPKKTADDLNLRESMQLHVNIRPVLELRDLFGTFKSKRSTLELKKEAQEGWKE